MRVKRVQRSGAPLRLGSQLVNLEGEEFSFYRSRTVDQVVRRFFSPTPGYKELGARAETWDSSWHSRYGWLMVVVLRRVRMIVRNRSRGFGGNYSDEGASVGCVVWMRRRLWGTEAWVVTTLA
ncbi:uncharacterized protein A4U43_C08F19200 [Asparagus officinalis]|nr:uncharacterized protein A4U43_C08F19200 [Asparagus officinalis]